jgi:alpha-L-rhamnosidase
MLEKGATTIWERWNTDSMGPEMNSRNHFAFGSVAQWFYETLGGLAPDETSPGFKRFRVKPEPVGDLTWAKASFRSEYGLVSCQWAREASHLKLVVAVPGNTSASLWAPLVGFSKLSEGGQPLLDGGKEVGQAAGLRFQRIEKDFAVFEAGSGVYTFLATN